MPITFTIWAENRVDGNLVEPSSMTLSDEDEVYGVRRSDNYEVVVPDATGMVQVVEDGGIYKYTFTDVGYGVSYTYSVESVNSGTSTYASGTITFDNQWVTSTAADTYFSTRRDATDYWVTGVDKDEKLRTAQLELYMSRLFLLPHPMPNAADDATLFPDTVEAAICEQTLFHLIDTGAESREQLVSQGVTRSQVYGETYKDVEKVFVAPRALQLLRAGGFAVNGVWGYMPGYIP